MLSFISEHTTSLHKHGGTSLLVLEQVAIPILQRIFRRATERDWIQAPREAAKNHNCKGLVIRPTQTYRRRPSHANQAARGMKLSKLLNNYVHMVWILRCTVDYGNWQSDALSRALEPTSITPLPVVVVPYDAMRHLVLLSLQCSQSLVYAEVGG